MYLKALEIQGFKSFPDKTRLQFDAEITAIVGPNGSGKSNISDAILWVMGEQSAKGLRGTKMEDVIFGGTAKRPSMGFAQVTLVLDNTGGLFPAMEEAEVSVTRRYYRSGDSEYYINRQTVRLRDVTDLLTDTGMGREGYSIIGQGRIDAILSARSGDRRDIFEEAAGIARFRRRKEEAERRLERTRQDLLRVDDKIAELSLQVEPLRKQAETAKRYLILRDELRVLEISLWMDALDELKRNARKLDWELRNVQEQRDAARAALDALYAEGERYGQQMQQKDIEAEDIRRSAAALDSQISALESAAAVSEATAVHNRETLERMTSEMSEQDGRAGSLRHQITEQSGRILRLDGELSEAKQNLEDLLTRAETAGHQADAARIEVEALRSKASLALSAAADAKAALSGLEAASAQLRSRQTELTSELRNRQEQANGEAALAEENRQALTEARTAAEAAENRVSGYALRLESRQKRAEAASAEQNRLTVERSTLEHQVRLLTEMEQNYEGFTKAVRMVMEAHLPGIRGPAGSLMTVDARHTVAIETALGGGLQNIVVEREEDGKAAINYLKRRDAGRATFLPLTAIRGQELQEPGLDQEPGYVGLASQLVQYDEVYREIFVNLLGRTVVVETLDHAIAVSRRYGRRFRLVTLDGQVVNRGGAMTGGSVSRNAGVLSRSAELRRLRERLTVLCQQEADAVRTADQAKRELAAARYELDTAGEDRRQAAETVLRLDGQRSHLESLLQTSRETIRTLEAEQQTLSARLSETDSQSDVLRTEIERQSALADGYNRQADEQLSGQQTLLEQSSALASEIAEQRTAMAALSAERETLDRNLAELQTLWQELSSDQDKRRVLLEQCRSNIAAADADAAQKRTAIQALRQQTVSYQERLTALQQEKLALEAERTAKNREGQSMNEQLLELERSAADWQQKRTAAASEEKQILDRLWERYELSHSDAQAQRVELENTQKATHRAAAIRKDMAELGTPNLGAIEEFDRVNERYTYLTGQRDDVERACQELEGVIRDITEEMTTVFAQQFELLAKTFQETFTDLFGGGQASLELEDKDDILNCGIEIRAQPPGKTLRTISLLSGGEKAFVAIALYFAIMKVHPTPFCVMDEIEAALDDANVARFARYLRRIADRTQCIVITHRRGTMEEADVLYGITMQEQGVSKMLTLNLDDMTDELGIVE